MTKLDQLMKDLCPNGVEYKVIESICSIDTGEQLNRSGLLEKGPFPVYNGGINPSGFHTEYNTPASTIAISQGGASAGFVNFVTVPFWAGAHCYTIQNIHSCINPRFLYFLLKNLEPVLQGKKQGAGIPGLNRKQILDLTIPVPPLAVQNEIVRILDAFTNLTAELTAELTARKQQYEYYRNLLLSFNNADNTDIDRQITPLIESFLKRGNNFGVEWVRLGDIADICRGVRVIKSQLNAKAEGYPVYQNSLIPLGYYDKANCIANTPFVISAGAAGDIGYSDKPYWAADDCLYFLNKADLNARYLYFILMNNQTSIKAQVRKASIPRLSRKALGKILIPVPSLEEQECIVKILDRFEALCNDISVGLPAEIKARQQQYEYYRNKLLTFNEVKA